MTGIYIHIPFCKSKCPYCDFYSFTSDETEKDSYLKAVLLCLSEYKDKISGEVDTIYFGGGTPSVFGGRRISRIIKHIKESYNLTDTEITVECNPSDVDPELLGFLRDSGVNRISMGMQSAVDRERRKLGRRCGSEQVQNAVRLIKSFGIDNISLDLMLGIPYQTKESLRESLDFITNQDIKHVSAYILKIEEGTPFSKIQLDLPDEDETCELYLFAARELEKQGFLQYEISNFAKKGFESKHNLRYWHCEEYLGVGPSAHSFLNGERFYFPADFSTFIEKREVVSDGRGGDEQEYIMLALRLKEGLDNEKFFSRFEKNIPEEIFKKALPFEKAGLLTIDKNKISLTKEGFLLSNGIISSLL